MSVGLSPAALTPPTISYQRLQGIKAEVDPKDVFHTEFTVQLPSNSGAAGVVEVDPLGETDLP